MSTQLNSITLLCDNTGSMGSACQTICQSAQQFKTMTTVLLGKECVRLAVYGDYDYRTPNNDRGGHAVLSPTASLSEEAIWLHNYMKPLGGGGAPEAIKTSLNFHLRETPVGPKFLFLFTDAPPHNYNHPDKEGKAEKKFLHAHQMITSWKTLCKKVKEHGFTVVTFLMNRSYRNIYSELGHVVCVSWDTSSDELSKQMMETFNALIGVKSSINLPVVTKIDLKKAMSSVSPSKVIEAFDRLLDVDYPNRAICLTTNDIIGKYWRLICGRYRFIENEKYASDCQRIMNKLSACKERMSFSNATRLKEWIDASHNSSYEIREIIKKAIDEVTQPIPCLVLPSELKDSIKIDKVLDLGRSGKSKELSQLIAQIELVKMVPKLPADEDTAPDFIPVNGLSESMIFRLLPNLVKTGLMFSSPVSQLGAILALKNKYLRPMAEQYLKQSKGKWLDFSLNDEGKPKHSLFFSYRVQKLLAILPNESLTKEERGFRDHFLMVTKIMRNLAVPVSVTIPISFAGNSLRHSGTYWKVCPRCQQRRCFSLFCQDKNCCVMCLPDTDEQGTNLPQVSDTVAWASCRTCTAKYSILRPHKLKMLQPKCHLCRYPDDNGGCERIQCTKCQSQYISISGSAMSAMKDSLPPEKQSDGFVCYACTHDPTNAYHSVDVRICDLIKENPWLKSLVPLSPYHLLLGPTPKLWKRVLELKSSDSQVSSTASIYYNKLTVINREEVIQSIIDTLKNHSGFETCSLCADEVPSRTIIPACGKCHNRICQSCSNSWYSRVKDGHLVSHCHTMCPFCKETPKHYLVKKLPLGHVRNIRAKHGRELCPWTVGIAYALCSKCMKIQPYGEQNCADHLDEDAVTDFVCEPCTAILESITIATKNCPSCTVSVQKTGGCNHITCQCGTHWCWTCKQDRDDQYGIFDEHTIYDHMSKCGGIFEVHLLF